MVNEEQGLQVEGVLGPKLRIRPSGLQGTPMNETFDVTERQNADNQIPTTIRPEMLLAVDSTFRAQFKSNETLLMYLIITFNAVNVRYLTVSAPRVKLKFCALEIFTATTETFLERTGNYVLGIPTLQKIKEYVRSHEEKYREYDGVYLVTGLDMAEYSYYGWNFGLMGYAYIGGICGELKVGYGEDSVGTFKGVRIFAHEAAHL
ncbi:hypothetical protein MTO96_035785 [Rhipicephalus appendiculatus]